jgi:pimeloyl-ACP methyl ester carboxylesterase
MQPPFTAYRGNDDYVFVCDSHSDISEVYEDLTMLRARGLNIWFDEGISPGTEWSEELAQALEGASRVLFYASNGSVSSRHCRDEINFSHNHDKKILVINLEDAALPAGLELSLSSTQSIQKYQLSTEMYLEKLFSVLPSSTVDSTTTVDSTEGSKPRKRKTLIGLAVASLLVIGAGLTIALDPTYWTARWIMFNADYLGSSIEQNISFATSKDDVRIAYATTGSGPPVLIVLGWATHLEDGMDSPAYDSAGVLAMSSEEHTIIRYDGRGFGLSDRNVEDFSLEARVADVEAVVDALGLERFALYAMSAGGVVGAAYASRHPNKVASLVLASTAVDRYSTDEELRRFDAMLGVFETSWDSPAVTNLMFEVIFPNMEGVNKEIFGEFLRRSANGPDLKGFFEVQSRLNVVEETKMIVVPTLVVHGRDDATIPLEAGRKIASLIPGARFEIVEGDHGAGVGMTQETRKLILDFIDSIPMGPE